MAVQQALLHIPVYDGKNMPLKTFIQDVENGYSICPAGIRIAFFKGVIAKLRDTARDAVIKYYGRIKKIMEGAKASLNEKFTEQQVPHMITMLEGIALESFKWGLPDEFLYALSVQEPGTLDTALRIAQRIERDMTNSTERKELLQLGPTGTQTTQPNSAQTRAPWTNNYRRGPNDNGYQAPSNNYRPKSPTEFRGTNTNSYQPRQAGQFQGQTYQRRTSRNYSPRELETYQPGTRPNYSPRGSGHSNKGDLN